MPNDVISKVYIVVRKENESCLLPSNGEEATFVGASAFGADAQSMARRALSLLGCPLSAGYLAFSASSDINKGWCVIADKRIICWRRIFDWLSTSADYWG